MSDRSTVSHILKMRDAAITADGVGMAFTIETTQGDQRVSIALRDIGNVVAFFASVAQVHENAFGDAEPQDAPADWTPIPTRGLGLATRDHPDNVELVVRLSGFDMGFEMPASELDEFVQRNAQVIRALAASGPRQ